MYRTGQRRGGQEEELLPRPPACYVPRGSLSTPSTFPAYFCKEKLTKRQYSQRYSRYWLQLMQKGFPNLVQPTHVLFRRFYAKYSYMYFKDDFQNTIGENVYITHVLGHTSSEPALTYANLHLAPNGAGKLKLFQIGKSMATLKTGNSEGKESKRDKRNKPREHTDLSQRRI